MIKEEVIECPTCHGWGGTSWSRCNTCNGDGAVVQLEGILNGRIEQVSYSTWKDNRAAA